MNDCPPETTQCVNSFSNYSCECRPGFQGQGSDCKGNTLTMLSKYMKLGVCILTLMNIFSYFNIFPIYHTITFVCQFIELDIDECHLGIHKCSQACQNLPGSYNCLCYYGFSLKEDRFTCEIGI